MLVTCYTAKIYPYYLKLVYRMPVAGTYTVCVLEIGTVWTETGIAETDIERLSCTCDDRTFHTGWYLH